jgi:hypothetical protein
MLIDSPYNLSDNEYLEKEIENWKYLADGLIYKHQRHLKFEVLLHISNLKEKLKQLK